MMRWTGYLLGGVPLVVLAALNGTVHAQPNPPGAQPDPAAAAAQPQPAENPPAENPPAEQPATEPENAPLPRIEDMEVPSMASLLADPPIDWVVLKNKTVVVSRPVYPRPDTLAKIQQQIDALEKRRGMMALEDWRAERAKLQNLTLLLPGEDDAPYEIDRNSIDYILHHEDLMLLRIDELIADSKFRDAFEMLFLLKRRQPEWPKIEDRHNDLLFAEAGIKIEAGEFEPALVLLEELAGRRKDYPELSQQFGAAIDGLVSAAVDQKDWRRARHFIARLGRREAQHAIVVKWQNDLAARANRMIGDSGSAGAAGRHDEAYVLAREATRVWPQSSSVKAGFDRAARRWQELRVGVTRLAGETTSFPLPTVADERVRRLTVLDLFEIDRIDESPHYRTRFFEQWEPADLGREAVFSLRQSHSYWESQPEVTAQAVASTLARRLDPGAAEYDERLDSYIRSLTIQSPFQLQVEFDRVPLRTEMVFTLPARQAPEPTEAGFDEEQPGAAQSGPGDASSPAEPLESAPLLTRRFVEHARAENQVSYRRVFPEPNAVGEYHVAEVVEQRYDSHDRAVQGLLRGEVSVLPHVENRDVPRLREDGRFFIQEYALPWVHLLQFNPRSQALRQREFRRALAYAVNRPKILQDLVLAGAEGQGRLVTAGWSTRSYAHNTIVRPREYDPTQALALSLAAKAALKAELPELRLVCDPDPQMQRVASELIRQWKLAGLNVILVPDDGTPVDLQSGDWDILYRRLKMVDPVTELWPLLVLEDRARVESLAHLPDWLRQKLIALEDETNWNAAVRQLQELHQDLWGEALWIPLFEVNDFLVVRKNIRGLAAAPVHPYHGVEEWIVDPWYPTETP